MPKISRETFASPFAIFFMYIIASGLVIMGFRFIFPAEPVPLAYFSFSWRLVRGFLDFLELFPALTLSALVIPFGFKIQAAEKNRRFSPQFFLSLKMSIITAITGAAIYGILFSLALPLARNYEANIRSQSRLYLLAEERARESASRGDWNEASQFTAICERIWPENPEIANLRTEAEIRTQSEELSRAAAQDAGAETWREAGAEPVNVTEALAMAETAMDEERYFDAHWLATLGSRLARPGSPEIAAAARLAGMAWDGVNSLAPNARETQAFNVFRLKRDGHEALVGEEWIRAYYIFLELMEMSPDDPDAAKYFAVSEERLQAAAFFSDEIELTLGQILSGAVFSLPMGNDRLVMRVSSLSTSPDCAYGIETEMMAFNPEGRPLWSMNVPYIKLLPLTLDSGSSLAVMFRAIDRHDQDKRWEPELNDLGASAPRNGSITLPVSWETFLLLSKVRRGLSGLSPADLKSAAETLGSCGYLPQVFEAELLERFVRPLFLLPLGIFAIGLGWQYRALKRSRYMAVLMLGILPVVFNGAARFTSVLLSNIGIWAAVSLGFNTAALCFAIGIVVILILSLILLASKHG